MSSVLHHQANIVLLGEFDTSDHIMAILCLDAVKWGVSKITGWISRDRGIDRGTCLNEWIAVANR